MSELHIVNDTVYAFIGFIGWLYLAIEERQVPQNPLHYFLACFITLVLGTYFVIRLIGALVFLAEA
jgi:hypothetical protein